jgi:glycosyltransferase involved in cell wall biosynthesis
MPNRKPTIKNIVFIGNYPPRRCGIATFTSDLCENFAQKNPKINCEVMAVNDISEGYAYPNRVHFEIKEQNIESYNKAADYINESQTDLLCLQHEYGIFGGQDGSHVLTLLNRIKAPVVTTFHTVKKEPTSRQERILVEIASLSEFVVVMTQKAADLLQAIYNIPPQKIVIIPHGIPKMNFIDPNFYKDQFSVEGKTVLSTFGLLSPNKGIEYAIRALPDIVKKFPDIIYIILGQTHPKLLQSEGENYRISLQRLATEIGVEKHVSFQNRFVTLNDLKEFLIMADIYVMPYLDEQQIVSGTLAYSFGAGNAIVSTPFWHAKELLADGKGVLVPFKNETAIANAIIELLSNPAARNAMRKQAFLLSRKMTWPYIVKDYKRAFDQARIQRPAKSAKAKKPIESLASDTRDLPDIKINHLLRLTDSTGILQHAKYSFPNYHEGYCTDDNARALILHSYLQKLEFEPASKLFELGSIYLAFLSYSFNEKTGRFRNFLSYNRQWLEETGSEDSHGRAIWALGTCVKYSTEKSFSNLAREIMNKSLPATLDFTSPRAWAFTLVGLYEYLDHFNKDETITPIFQTLANKLHQLYQTNHTPDWLWFEDILTYANAKLSHALIIGGHTLSNQEMFQAGLNSLQWLCQTQTSNHNYFQPISNAFYQKNAGFPLYDHQPIEAQASLSACLEAYRLTKDIKWHHEAWKIFQWYLGRNPLSASLYDPHTGGCFDGLHEKHLNQNQGAESTLSFLLSLSEMIMMNQELQSLREPSVK